MTFILPYGSQSHDLFKTIFTPYVLHDKAHPFGIHPQHGPWLGIKPAPSLAACATSPQEQLINIKFTYMLHPTDTKTTYFLRFFIKIVLQPSVKLQYYSHRFSAIITSIYCKDKFSLWTFITPCISIVINSH